MKEKSKGREMSVCPCFLGFFSVSLELNKDGRIIYMRPSLSFTVLIFILYDALCHHGTGYLHEAGYIGAFYVVDVVGCTSVAEALGVYVAHDLMQSFVHFLGRPGYVHGVLGHFQTGSCYTS